MKAAASSSRTRPPAAVADAAKYRQIAIHSAISSAITDGRIPASETAEWETKLATNYDTASAELVAKKPSLDTRSLHLRPTGARGDLSTEYGRRTAFNCALDKHLAKGLTFNQAVAEMKSDPEESAIIAAMNQAKQ